MAEDLIEKYDNGYVPLDEIVEEVQKEVDFLISLRPLAKELDEENPYEE